MAVAAQTRRAADTDMGSNWVTGIVEVPLSLEAKMANIEETEAAKKRMLAASRGAGGAGLLAADDEDEEQVSAGLMGVCRGPAAQGWRLVIPPALSSCTCAGRKVLHAHTGGPCFQLCMRWLCTQCALCRMPKTCTLHLDAAVQ